MAHHREEFGPEEPDIALYANYPITKDSLRRKLVRDISGQTGARLFRNQMRGFKSTDARVRNTLWKMTAVQIVIASLFVLAGHPWLYPHDGVQPRMTCKNEQ